MPFFDVFTKEAAIWTYGRLLRNSSNSLDMSQRQIVANEDYVKITLKSMHIVYKRRWFSEYYPVVYSFCALGHFSGRKAEVSYVTTPPKLAELDKENLDRVIQFNQVVLGPIPYRGGGLAVQMGLFSVKSKDLAKPIIELVKNVAEKSGVRFISTVVPYGDIVRQGAELLGGDKDTILEIGVATNYNPLLTGYYTAIAAPKGVLEPEKLIVDNTDFSLYTEDGVLVTKYPYMIFEITASQQREDWFEVPDVITAYTQLQADLRTGNTEKTDESFRVFRRIAITSPDFIDADAEALVEKLNEKLKKKLGAMTVARGSGAELEPLRSLDLYGKK